MLTAASRVLAARGGSLVLASPSPPARRALALLGVDQLIAAAHWASEGVELPGNA